MRMINKMILILGVGFAVFVISTSPVYAYLDPGTGSMIMQTIAAIVLTAGTVLGIFRQKIKNFFLNLGKRWKKDTVKDQPSDRQSNKRNRR